MRACIFAKNDAFLFLIRTVDSYFCNMKKITLFLFSATAAIMASCVTSKVPDEGVRISWDKSTYCQITEMPLSDGTVESNLYYPRVKRLPDGALLLTFMNDHLGWEIFATRSEDDGKTWAPAQKLLSRHPAQSTVGDDEIVYVNPDFICLSDGRLMLAYQWRYLKGYGDLPHTNENCGIGIIFSDDWGQTWGEPRNIYRGRCWEPAMLELPSGEIHLYLTDSQNVVNKMSCPKTSLIRSFDGGRTWQGKEECTWKDVEGISYTIDDRFGYDGMATAVLLDDGSIAMTVEVWSGKYVVDQTPVVVLSRDNWKVDQKKLLEEGGPAYPDKRQVNKDFIAYGPYIARTPDGEVLVNANGLYKGMQGTWILVGDKKAGNFGHATSPFPGYWDSVDYIGDGKIIVTSTEKYTLDGATRGRINIIQGRLNRGLEVPGGYGNYKPVGEFDPSASGLWFLGGKYDSSVYYDFGATESNFVFNTWVLDKKLTAFTPENSDASVLLFKRAKWTYKLVVNAAGKWVLSMLENNSWHIISEGKVAEYDLAGTVNDDSDTDTGFAAQVRIPWGIIGGSPVGGEALKAHPAHWDKARSAEKGTRLWEELDGENSDYPSEWLTLRLK